MFEDACWIRDDLKALEKTGFGFEIMDLRKENHGSGFITVPVVTSFWP
jgi:hypothetical protein